jgi:hypothetical protein
LFTGRWPRGAFDYLVGTVRWFYRAIVYIHLMTDAYPPSSLADDPAYPLWLQIDYPEHIDNWRPLVQSLLAIPYLWIAGVLYRLTGVLTVVAFFTVLFTTQIPRGVFELIVPGLRWNLRGNAYGYFMTDRLSPVRLGIATNTLSPRAQRVRPDSNSANRARISRRGPEAPVRSRSVVRGRRARCDAGTGLSRRLVATAAARSMV